MNVVLDRLWESLGVIWQLDSEPHTTLDDVRRFLIDNPFGTALALQRTTGLSPAQVTRLIRRYLQQDELSDRRPGPAVRHQLHVPKVHQPPSGAPAGEAADRADCPYHVRSVPFPCDPFPPTAISAFVPLPLLGESFGEANIFTSVST